MPQAVSCSPFLPLRPMPPTTSSSTTIGKPPTNTAKRPSKLHWIPNASLPGRAGPFGVWLNRWVERLWPAAVNALFQAICGPVMRAPSMRSISSGWPPSSAMQTVSKTFISSAFAVAAAVISLASASSSLNVCRMSSSVLKLDTAIDGFDLGVKLKSRASRLAERRGRGALDATEGGVDQIAGRRPVDLDRAGFDIAGKRVHQRRVTGRDRSGQAIFTVIGLCNRILVTFNLDEGEDRPKDLLTRNSHGLTDVGEHGRPDVIAVIVAGAGQAIGAVHHDQRILTAKLHLRARRDADRTMDLFAGSRRTSERDRAHDCRRGDRSANIAR